MLIALRLAKEGFCGGDPERILKMRVDLVVASVEYVAFCGDYEKAFIELNKGEQ